MQVNPIALNTVHTIDRRLIYYGLALSVCLHYAGFLVATWLDKHSPIAAPEKARQSIGVRLKEITEASAEIPVKELLEEVAVKSKRKKKAEAIQAPVQPKKGASEGSQLLLDRESILKILQEDQKTMERPTTGYSENQAVVLNPELLRKLNQSTRRIGKILTSENSDTRSSFIGGSWTNHVRIDDMCFRVTEADPLDSLSREIWYRVDCVN